MIKNCRDYYVTNENFPVNTTIKASETRTIERYEQDCNTVTDIRISKGAIPRKKYLIAYLSPYNDRVLTDTIKAPSQKEAIYDFGLRNANCDIIAITLIEE